MIAKSIQKLVADVDEMTEWGDADDLEDALFKVISALNVAAKALEHYAELDVGFVMHGTVAPETPFAKHIDSEHKFEYNKVAKDALEKIGAL